MLYSLFIIQVVGNSLKSLEVSEEKANQRVEEFKREMKTLSAKLKEAEQRAEHAEKQVKRLQKEVDRLEGKSSSSLPVPFPSPYHSAAEDATPSTRRRRCHSSRNAGFN